jgi:hypothetical protein
MCAQWNWPKGNISIIHQRHSPQSHHTPDTLFNMQLIKQLTLAAFVGMQAVNGATFGAPLAFAAPSKLPSVEVMQGFPDVAKINIAEHCAGKNVIIVGLPGAFTPT